MKRLFLAAFSFAATLSISPLAQASDDECAIWLCLPSGFPSGCGDAKDAMEDRVKDFKPPLPDFLSCAVSSPSAPNFDMRSAYGVAAYLPARNVCVRERQRESGSVCIQWEARPQEYIRGKHCSRNRETGERSPAGCTKTVNWAEVFANGQLAGPTHYW